MAPLEAPAGTAYNYRITAKNLGPDPTTSGYVANLLPAGVKVVGASTDRGTANIAGNFVSLENAPLGVGESATINIAVVPEQLGQQQYSGMAASPAFDPDLTNNATQAQTLVTLDGPLVNPDKPCIDMPDLVGKFSQVSRKGKFKKKTGEWTYKVQAKVEVTNIGTGCALANSTVRLYLSKDPILDSSDMLIGGKQIKKLCPPKKAGKAPKPKKISIKAKLAPGVNPVGCYLIAVLDADDSVVECNENNNIALSLD